MFEIHNRKITSHSDFNSSLYNTVVYGKLNFDMSFGVTKHTNTRKIKNTGRTGWWYIKEEVIQ